MIQLSSSVKNALDTVLSLAGAGAAYLASNASALSAHYSAELAIVGGIAGYAISDAVSFVNTAAVDLSQVKSQALSSWNQGKAELQAVLAKIIPEAQQPIAQAFFAALDAEMKKLGA